MTDEVILSTKEAGIKFGLLIKFFHHGSPPDTRRVELVPPVIRRVRTGLDMLAFVRSFCAFFVHSTQPFAPPAPYPLGASVPL